jgi:HD-GYP domain-containing protein (c-di-GMP phosphodiesterase class II)
MTSDIALFEHAQRKKTLAAIAWTVLVTSVALGLYDIQFNTWVSVIALFALGLVCVPILVLNHRDHLRLSALLLSLVVLLAITLNLYDGDGLHDAGILAMPVFIMTGTLMFGKRAAVFFALAAILALTAIVYLEVTGYVHPTLRPTTYTMLVPMIMLLVAASAIVWVIVDRVERNILRAWESEAELRRSYDLTLEAWSKILEHRDRETRGHTERVAALTDQLSRRMGLSGQSLVDIRRGALLHDIGKLAIPDSILLKRGELTEAEWAMMREHPSLAYEVLAPIPYLHNALDIPWCHHEKWDGTGYPRSLRGDEIPLAARLFAVVDVWDALTSDRPYRPAMDEPSALEHIRLLAGAHFDPAVVAAFVDLQTAQPGAGH